MPVCSDRTARLAGLVLALAPSVAAFAQEPNPSPSPSPSQAPALPKLQTEVAFPNLRFDRPVALAEPGDGSNLLFIVEQHQTKIWSFPNQKETADKQLFLQLPVEISRDNEEGLLGLAFHPKYKENGQFFVYYSAKEGPTGRRSVVSRFRATRADPRKADPASEERVWVGPDDPYGNHNGGCIAFGPDGFLYISLGDSGFADDPLMTGQNPRDHFGSILRIDVDHPEGDKPYGIPKDNPRLRDKTHAHWAPEVYAIGLRNVWKFSFDRRTGTLWAGDVGQNKWEMVHIIQNGGNYGWSINEAFHPFKPRQRVDPAAKVSRPVVEYPHSPGLDRARQDVGLSITGGHVYRGKALPELEGVYVYGDFESGRIWGLRERDGQALANAELVDLTKSRPLHIAAFGEDAAGELYILAFESQIYRLVPRP